jgi:hypothetical protein
MLKRKVRLTALVKQYAIAPLSSVSKLLYVTAALSWLSIPVCAILTIGIVSWFYASGMYSAGGKPFAWFDGISAWPSIEIVLFAAFLAIHFISKTQFDLTKSAAKLEEEFGLGEGLRNDPNR